MKRWACDNCGQSFDGEQPVAQRIEAGRWNFICFASYPDIRESAEHGHVTPVLCMDCTASHLLDALAKRAALKKEEVGRA